ncbi:MAG: sigma-70 family RNA polymerase sigma factor [Lachnospiraceae bacterium]|nr:sigma-70 family RNA polymerase sigma factor [Lachnospiraceae bacterium]
MCASRGSFEELYQKNYSIVHSYIRRVLQKDDFETEELTQQVFLEACQKWDEIKEHPDLTGFLMAVANNRVKKWFDEKNQA